MKLKNRLMLAVFTSLLVIATGCTNEDIIPENIKPEEKEEVVVAFTTEVPTVIDTRAIVAGTTILPGESTITTIRALIYDMYTDKLVRNYFLTDGGSTAVNNEKFRFHSGNFEVYLKIPVGYYNAYFVSNEALAVGLDLTGLAIDSDLSELKAKKINTLPFVNDSGETENMIHTAVYNGVAISAGSNDNCQGTFFRPVARVNDLKIKKVQAMDNYPTRLLSVKIRNCMPNSFLLPGCFVKPESGDLHDVILYQADGSNDVNITTENASIPGVAYFWENYWGRYDDYNATVAPLVEINYEYEDDEHNVTPVTKSFYIENYSNYGFYRNTVYYGNFTITDKHGGATFKLSIDTWDHSGFSKDI